MILTKEQVELIQASHFGGTQVDPVMCGRLIESHESLRSVLDIAMGALKFYGFIAIHNRRRARNALAQLERVLNEGELR